MASFALVCKAVDAVGSAMFFVLMMRQEKMILRLR